MKKVTSTETIEFLIRGIKGTPTEQSVTINEKGVIVSDEDATLIVRRFGGLVTITNADTKTVKAAVEEALEVAEAVTETEEVEEVADPKKKAK
jgi:cobyrinic acid a,c-diamide synthase